jgi:beta-phosphoglucomutase-like phosphatase (HAD superfamily)
VPDVTLVPDHDPVPAPELMAVLFDMDGLLVDTEPLWFEVETSVMARLGGSWGPDDQAALVGGSLERSLNYLLGKATRPASRAEVAGWMVAGMVELLTTRDVPVMPGARDRACCGSRRPRTR